jgi:DNA adenine methylase
MAEHKTHGPLKTLRPLLRWAGSKRQLLGPLRSLLPQDEYTYVEPFCGSAALFFEAAPRKAILADVNVDLINFYKHCRKNPDDVYEIAQTIPRTKRSYYRIRSVINQTDFGVERAAYWPAPGLDDTRLS